MFSERLNMLLKEKGIPDTKLINDLSLGKNAIYFWRKSGSLPGSATLEKLANYFGVSTDFLLDKKNPSDAGEVDDIKLRKLQKLISSLSDSDFEKFYDAFCILYDKPDR